MSEKRKIQKLEEEVEEKEKENKKLDRQVKKLERDLKELEGKYEALVQSKGGVVGVVLGQASSASSPEQTEKRDLQAKIDTLQKEVDSLRLDLSRAEERVLEAQKQSRASLFRDVDQTEVKRDLQKQVDDLKRQLEKEREGKFEEIQQVKREYEEEWLKDKKKGRRTASRPVGNSKSSSLSGSFESLNQTLQTGDAQSLAKELQQVRQQLSQTEASIEKINKANQKQLLVVEEKLQEANTAKERIEKRFLKYESEAKTLASQLEKEVKLKNQYELDKIQNQRQIRDLEKRVADLQAELLTEKNLNQKTKARYDEMFSENRSTKDQNNQIQRDYEAQKKSLETELNNLKNSSARRIAALEREVEDSKKRASSVEGNESQLATTNRQLLKEIENLKSQLEQQQMDAERDKKKLERSSQSSLKQAQEEIETLKEDIRKLEEKKKKDIKTIEDLQNQLSVVSTRPTEGVDTSKLETELSKERDRLSLQKLSSDLSKLREEAQQTEKQLQDEVDELKNKLREKDKQLQKERDRFLDEEKQREKEQGDDRKQILEKEKKRLEELENLNTQIIDLKKEKLKLEDQVKKLSEDLRQLEDDYDDEREERKLDNERNNLKVKHVTDELVELQADIADLSAELRRSESQLKDALDEARELKRALEDKQIVIEDLQGKISEATSKLEVIQVQAKQKEESLMNKLEVVQNEANSEAKEKERQIKLRSEAEKRIEELEWYFFPLEQQNASAIDFATPAVALLKNRKKELTQELDDLRKRFAKRTDTIEELHPRLVQALQKIPETNKEAIAYQLQGLMQVLEEADYPVRVRLKIAVSLIEGFVDPEIIREIRILTEIMIDDSLHLLETPETVVILSQREVDNEKTRPDYHTLKRTEILSFRDALLNRLAVMRAKRMRKPVAEVSKGILDELYSKIDG